MGTCALVPQIVRAVQVPVIAAGGIADAKGVAAAMAAEESHVTISNAVVFSDRLVRVYLGGELPAWKQ
jgi:nitronate monooxygenase